jgi:hypothetical protein
MMCTYDTPEMVLQNGPSKANHPHGGFSSSPACTHPLNTTSQTSLMTSMHVHSQDLQANFPTRHQGSLVSPSMCKATDPSVPLEHELTNSDQVVR